MATIAFKPFTVENYHAMAAAGIIAPNDRVELLQGQVIQMSPQGSRHYGFLLKLQTLLVQQLQGTALLAVQGPIALNPLSEPEPDLAVLRLRADYYQVSLPTAGDLYLLIEVADSSLTYDREQKLPAYAQAGIPEVWVCNIVDDQIEVYTEPNGADYQQCRIAHRGDSLSPLLLPHVKLALAEVLA